MRSFEMQEQAMKIPDTMGFFSNGQINKKLLRVLNLQKTEHLKEQVSKRFQMKPRVKEILVSKIRRSGGIENKVVTSLSPQEIPKNLLKTLEECASILNLANVLFKNEEKTIKWFSKKTPRFGNISPRDMVILGRFDQLQKFILMCVELSHPPKP